MDIAYSCIAVLRMKLKSRDLWFCLASALSATPHRPALAPVPRKKMDVIRRDVGWLGGFASRSRGFDEV